MDHMKAIESTMSFLGYRGDIQSVNCTGSVNLENKHKKTGESN